MSRPPVAALPPVRLSPIALATRLVLCGLSASAAALLVSPDTALAQALPAAPALHETQVRQYDLPAGPLGRSLAEFATQSGLLLSFDPNITSGLQAPALQGGYAPIEGLQVLLAGSNLEIARRPDSSYTVRQKQSGGKVTELQEVTVVGNVSAAAEVYTAPRSSVYISGAEIERYVPISTGDLFKGVPGVQVGDTRNGGALDVNIRGVQGQSRIAVTVDGAQQALDVYRGYAGTQQRSYIDPDLLSSITINKGPSLDSGTGGNALGGSVAMQTIGVKDILLPGQTIGLRLTGSMWNNGVKPEARGKTLPKGESLAAELHEKRGDLFGSDAQAGSIAFAISSEYIDFVAAYAKRTQGNYFAGKHGQDKYRVYDKYGEEQGSVATTYMPGEEVLNSSSETQSVLLKTTIRPAAGHTVDLSYRNYDGHQTDIMPSDIFRFGTANIYQYPAGHTLIDTFTLGYRFDPADNPLVNLKGQLWMTDARSSTLSGWIVPTSQFFMNDRGWVRQKNRRIGGDLGNRSEFNSSIGQFALDIGGSFQIEELNPQSSVVITQYDLNANRTVRDAHRREFNLSGKLEYKPTDKLTIWGGARFTHFKTRDRNRHATPVETHTPFRMISVSWPDGRGVMYWLPDANGQFTDASDPRKNNGTVWKDYSFAMPMEDIGPEYTSDVWDGVYEGEMTTGYAFSEPVEESGSTFAPGLGISYELTRDTFAYVSYTQAVRLPSLFETSLGTSSLLPAQGLKPERAKNWEIGLSTIQSALLTPRDTLSLKLAYFNNNIKNYITRYEDPAGWGAPRYGDLGWGMMSFSNTDHFKVNGLEFQSQYDSGRLFMDLSATHYFGVKTCDADFAAHLRASAHQFLHTENTPDCTPGSFMGSYANTQNPPKYAVNLTLGSRFLDETLTIGGRMVFTSGPTEEMNEPWQFNSTTPQLIYRPVTVVDAFLDYQFHKQASVNVSLQNITNRYYLDPLSQSFMPAPGRTLNVGLKLQM
ncbi:TonB-dependent receptor domain-containing protein [Kerstersia similis]|uniref:TonB-dependent receptor n=1 Tax=Kerstersia similis TaxID=206505 RepID=UPI0039EF2787